MTPDDTLDCMPWSKLCILLCWAVVFIYLLLDLQLFVEDGSSKKNKKNSGYHMSLFS